MLSFHRCVTKGELWLPCVAALSHADPVHLLLDVTVLASLYLVELSLGTLRYAEACAEVFLLTLSVQMWVYWAFGRSVRGGGGGGGARAALASVMRHTKSIGCTSYAIGMLVVHAQRFDYFEFVLFRGLRVHTSNAPMLVYVLATCLARDASVLGHLGAGLAGWVVGSGGLSFLHGYFFACLILWLVVALLVSLKETTLFWKEYLGCVRVKCWPPWEERAGEEVEEEENSQANNDNANNNGGGSGAVAAAAHQDRGPRIRTVVNDEPFVQWVAAARIALALARDQAEVDAAESKRSEAGGELGGGEGEGIEMVASSSKVSGGRRSTSGGAAPVVAPDFGSVSAELSSTDDDEFFDAELEHEEASLLGGGGGGETKHGNYSSRVGQAFGGLRRQGRRGRRHPGGSNSGADVDDLV